MKSLSYEQHEWVKLNRRTVKSKLKQGKATSTVFCYGAKPYALISCHYHIRKFWH